MLSLRRKILSNPAYDKVIEKVTCKKHYVGKGDTSFSVSKMKLCVERYQYQMKGIAQLLKADTLEKVCENIQNFCYNFFDYEADKNDQFLRSPACSWFHRFAGIDCKSYSIIASSILSELGINHFIRKVSYDKNDLDNYTHVYVVVPLDQKTKNWIELEKANYYMIDGTINSMFEVEFVSKRDEFMSNPHYILNGPNKMQHALHGFSFNNISWSSITNLFNSTACWGGNAYTPELLTANMANAFTLFSQLIEQFNTNLANGNFTEMAKNYADIKGWGQVLFVASRVVRYSRSWSECNKANFEAFDKLITFFALTNVYALDAFIDRYFDKQALSEFSYSNLGLESSGWYFIEVYGQVPLVYTATNYKLTPKNMVTVIPAFEYTAPLMDNLNAGVPVDFNQYLDTLQNAAYIVSAFVGPGNNTGTQTGGSYTTSDGQTIDYTNPNTGNNTKTASVGWVAGGLLGLAALGYYFNTKK